MPSRHGTPRRRESRYDAQLSKDPLDAAIDDTVG
jgi:hypothetical protein